MANELTVQDISNMSVAFAKSGFFGYKSAAEAFSLMCIAQANGLHPAKAAERYHIIQGRPAMKADAMLSSFQESGGKVKWLKRTDTECRLWLSHPQGGELEVCWTIERAKKAGLTGKSTWSQYPTQMLSARCVSEGVRALFPACLCGMYTPEEVSDFGTAPQVPTFSEQPEQAEAEVIKDEPKKDVNTLTAPLFDAPAKDDEFEGWKAGMIGLAKQNGKAYKKGMADAGYKDLESVPPELRNKVFNHVQSFVNAYAMAENAAAKSGPTAQEQTNNDLFNGENENG